jgi:hypothetical protein
MFSRGRPITALDCAADDQSLYRCRKVHVIAGGVDPLLRLQKTNRG